MINIDPPLKYFPIKVGEASINFQNGEYSMSVKNKNWMGHNTKNNWQTCEFVMELTEANGVCVTTGLGLGIIQSILCQNPAVKKVIAIEKSADVIQMFIKIAEYNNFDITKIEFINQDANTISGLTVDCLFPDHFDSEPESEIIESVRKISINNEAKMLWYWPGSWHFFRYCESFRLPIDNNSYEIWKKFTKIRHLPTNLSDNNLKNLKNLKEKYIKDSIGRFKHILKSYDDRNKLINRFGKK